MNYKMIDLFSGIGGFRLGFEKTNQIDTVFSCEINNFARQTYEANFGDIPFPDITQLETNQLPSFDILVGGFPCQAFSISGKRRGFEDTRGTLFFEIARILKDTRPKAFLLENVRGLVSHKKGQTFATIIEVLKELNYQVFFQILDAKDFALAQKRKSIFIVGFREDIDCSNFEFPKPLGLNMKFKDVKEEEEVSSRFYLSTTTLASLRRHRNRHQEKGNGFGYEIIGDDDIANTLLVGGMGREKNLVIDDRLTDFTPKTRIKGEINREYIRYMTPREWARLQGFPDNFKIIVSPTQAYKQFGNAVPVNVIYHIALKILSILDENTFNSQ